MRQAREEKKLRKALAKGLKKALKARAKGNAPPLPPEPSHPVIRHTDPRAAPALPPSPVGRSAREGWWLLAGLALNLPPVAFVLLHQLVLVGGYLPGGLSDLLVWVAFLMGRLGFAFTLIALGMAVGANLSGGVRPKARAALWLAVALSGLACCYAWQLPA